MCGFQRVILKGFSVGGVAASLSQQRFTIAARFGTAHVPQRKDS
jgi:hypothetical protein